MPKIKTKARKGRMKGTLNYISKGGIDNERDTHNLLSAPDDIRGIEQEMLDMASTRGTRTYYHDHVSFHPKNKEVCTPEFMREFSEYYISKVYPEQQVLWCVHRDKEHVHVHLCVSATNLDGNKLHFGVAKISKQDRVVQDYAKDRGLIYMNRLELTKEKGRGKIKSAKKERQLVSKKDLLYDRVNTIINEKVVQTKHDFKVALEKEGLLLSKRETGIVFENKIYRFKTIGYDNNLYKKEAFEPYRTSKTKDKIKEKKLNDLFKNIKSKTKTKYIKKEQDKGFSRGLDMGR
jgi:hypothetical protein